MRWAGSFGAKILADLENYKPKSADSKPKIALTEDEIRQILFFNIDTLPVRPQLKRTLTKVRDHFVLSCFIGQRYSDAIRVEKNNFSGSSLDTFSIVQQKTGNKAEFNFNKLYGEYPSIVKKLLEKYEYKAPWDGHLTNKR